jgi:hypothetical protein
MNTDLQLKRVLVKMLPELIIIGDRSACLYYREKDDYGIPVLDSELLDLCRLAEATLTPQEAFAYVNVLVHIAREIPKGETRLGLLNHFVVVHASWQQKVTALAQIKKIKIK